MATKSSVSAAAGYQAIGEFWDTHDATEHGADDAAEFDVRISGQRHYFPVDGHLWLKIRALAGQRGVSEAALLNLFLQERIEQLEAVQEK